MAASRSTHCSPRAASPSSGRNASPGTMVLRAWARSTAANFTWLNLIGTCGIQRAHDPVPLCIEPSPRTFLDPFLGRCGKTRRGDVIQALQDQAASFANESEVLIRAVPLQAGFLRRVHESLQRRFLGPWKDHRQRAKNRNRRLFRVGSAV